MNKPIVKKLFTILFFIIILTIGYNQKKELYQLLKNTRFNWLLTGLFFYLCNYLSRAYRLQLLADNKAFPFSVSLKTSSIHGFYSYFLPLRSGDLSLPLLLKSYTSLSLTSGGVILLRARLLDMFSLGILLATSSLLSYNKLNGRVIALFMLASVILLGAPFLIKLAINKGKKVRSAWINEFAHGAAQYPMTMKECGLSLLIWFWTGCTLFSATRALSIPMDFMDIWFLVAIQLPLQLFPIQGVANTGNHEAGWVTGFTLLGISPEQGLEFALASHVIIIGYVLLLGLMGFLIPGKKNQSPTRS